MKVVKVTESASGQTVFLLKRSGRERRVNLAWAVAAGFGGVAAFLLFVYVTPPHGWPPSLNPWEVWGWFWRKAVDTSGGVIGGEPVIYGTFLLLICLGVGFQVSFNPEVRLLVVDITEGSLRSHNHFLLFNWGSQAFPFMDVNKIYLTQKPDQIWSVEVNVGDKDRPLADISNERDARLLSQTLARLIKAELLEREAPVEVEHAAG